MIRITHTEVAWGRVLTDDLRPAYDFNERWEQTRGDLSLWALLGRGPELDFVWQPAVAGGSRDAANQKGFRGQQHYRTPVRSTSSEPAMTFTNILYGRPQVSPGLFDLGAVLTAQGRPFELWNATFGELTVTSIAETSASGVEVVMDGGVTVPFTLRPLQSVTGRVQALPSGPARIEAAFDFIVTGVQRPPRINVIGRRSTVIAIAPDTSKPYLERLQWSTDIITSYDGTEQRISVHDAADTVISMTVQRHGRLAHALDAFIWGWQDKVYTIPLWHRPARLTAPAQSGQDELLCPTAGKGFKVGSLAMLWASDNLYEVHEVAEVLSDRVVLVTQVSGGWPSGSLLMACRPSRLPSEVQSQWTHADLASFKLSFVYTELEEGDGLNWGDYYRGYSVLLQQPNWVNAQEERAIRDMDVFETDTKARFSRNRGDSGGHVRSFSWFLKGEEAISRFRAWLYARRGRAVPFWAPSWKADFTMLETVEAESPNLVVGNVGYQLLDLSLPGKRDIIVWLRDGRRLYRRIVRVATGETSASEVLILDSAVGERIAPNQVRMISLLGLYRLDADEAELEWKSDKLVLCTQNMRLISNGVQ